MEGKEGQQGERPRISNTNEPDKGKKKLSFIMMAYKEVKKPTNASIHGVLNTDTSRAL